jgi:VanZ family protein
VSPPGERLEDVSLNFVCFVPFGFVLAAAFGQKGSMILRATALCAAASLSVEAAQVFFAYRMPCVSDWAANTSGAVVGASLAWTSWRRRLIHKKFVMNSRPAAHIYR